MMEPNRAPVIDLPSMPQSDLPSHHLDLRSPVTSWGLTALLVVVAFGLRLAIHPLVGSGAAYSIFLPVIVLAAYAFGRLHAVVAAFVCATLAFFFFVEPRFSMKLAADTVTAYGLFLLACAVAIVVITGLTGALRDLGRELGQAQAVADSHAGLFRELNERMSHHLRLVAGVLALQARGEPEPQVAESLRRAMERTLLISRVHRELGGRREPPVAFDAFAAALARAVCLSRGQPADRVTVISTGLMLSMEETTSLGVALAECLGALLDTGAKGALSVRLDAGGRAAEVAISEAEGTGEGALVSVTSGYLLRAMAEQLGANVTLRADARGSALVLSLPREAGAAGPPPEAPGEGATLH